MTLLEIALQHAARGWYVFPCKPQDKYPITPNGWHDASRDEALIQTWWRMTPNANVGIACGMSGLAVLDIDTGLQDYGPALAVLIEGSTYAVESGRRPVPGLHLYYKGAIPDVKGWEFDNCKGDVKSLGGYVLAAGSIHPSGEIYREIGGDPHDLALTPPLVRSLKSAAIGTGKDAAPVEGGRNNYLTSVAGKMRNAGLGAEALELALLQHNADVCKPPLPEEEVKAIAAHVARYDVPEADPIPVLSSSAVEVTDEDDADDVEDSPRPKYPDEVWNGTAYGEFADLCTRDNYVPKKFFAESFRTVVGALVGDRLRCTLTGVNPRAYTITIAPPGSGKGTSHERVREFFSRERWDGLERTEAPLLWDDPNEFLWRSRGLGAQSISPASAPGLIKGIESRKLKKGETSNPAEMWKPMPRVITMSEEVRSLFANFANESTGAGLESVLCELYDRDSFTSTATKDRGPASGKLMYSLLGGITKEGWDSVFSKVESVESGFLSRVNIIGTEETRTVAGLKPPDFEPLRARFLPVLQDLERNPRVIDASPNAMSFMDRWYSRLTLPEGISRARLNIHAWRTALHLAWLRGHSFILDEDVDCGIQVAEYLAHMREFYAPPEGETRGARCEAIIRRVMRTKRRITVRELRRKTNSTRYGIGIWDKALKALAQAGEIRLAEEAKGRMIAILLRIKD